MARLTWTRLVGIIALCVLGILGILAVQLFFTTEPQLVVVAQNSPLEPTVTNAPPSVVVAQNSTLEPSVTNPPPPVACVRNSTPTPVDSYAMMPLPPQSLQEFVRSSDIIVIGRISRVTKEGFEGPYSTSYKRGSTKTPDTSNGGSTPTPVPDMPQFPFSYFDLEIIEVIANPRGLQLSDSISIRHGGLYSTRCEIPLDPPFYEIGEQRLYSLAMNPDGTYGTLFGAWGALDIDGDVVTYRHVARPPIKFTDRTSPDAFIQAIKDQAAKQ